MTGSVVHTSLHGVVVAPCMPCNGRLPRRHPHDRPCPAGLDKDHGAGKPACCNRVNVYSRIVGVQCTLSVYVARSRFSHIAESSAGQVLKQEWPQRWPSFVPDLVGASKTSETLCENSMIILKLLSEEVFDFSRGSMTQVQPPAAEQHDRLWSPLCCVSQSGRQPDAMHGHTHALSGHERLVPASATPCVR